MTFPRRTPGMSDAEYERAWKKAIKKSYVDRLSDPHGIDEEILAGGSSLPRVTRRAPSTSGNDGTP